MQRDEKIKKVCTHPAFLELTRKKTRFSFILSMMMVCIYFGFILVLAFSPDTLGQPIAPGAITTIGIPIGILVIISALILTGIYVYRTNTQFDKLNQAILEELSS